MTSNRALKKRQALVTRRQSSVVGIPSKEQVELFSHGLLQKLGNDLQEQFEDDVETVLGFMTHPTPELRPSTVEAASQLEIAIAIADRKAADAQKLRDSIVDAFSQPKRRGFLSA